jgi:hypothetical protein
VVPPIVSGWQRCGLATSTCRRVSKRRSAPVAASRGDQVRAACQWPAVPQRVVWHDHPEYGRRLLVVARDEQGRLLRIILQPVDPADGTWRLRTVLVGEKGA